MRAVNKVLNGLIDQIIATPSTDKATAVTGLVLYTTGISAAQAGDWLDNVASIYVDCGLLSTGTFEAWRDDVVSKGVVSSKAQADIINSKLVNADDLRDVNVAIRERFQQDYKTNKQVDIDALEVFRDAQTDPVIIQALNLGLRNLRNEKDAGFNTLRGRRNN